MKKTNLKLLVQGLKNLQSNYYCKFSEREHLIVAQVISVIEKIIESKTKWFKAVRKVTKIMVTIWKVF